MCVCLCFVCVCVCGCLFGNEGTITVVKPTLFWITNVFFCRSVLVVYFEVHAPSSGQRLTCTSSGKLLDCAVQSHIVWTRSGLCFSWSVAFCSCLSLEQSSVNTCSCLHRIRLNAKKVSKSEAGALQFWWGGQTRIPGSNLEVVSKSIGVEDK